MPWLGPESLGREGLGQGWTERMLFDTVAAVVPGARAVRRHLDDVGCAASHEDVQGHFPVHPETPIAPERIDGTLTSIRAVRRRVGPDNRSNLLERNDRRRIHWIDPALLEGLKRAFDLADARPDLLCRCPRRRPSRSRPSCRCSGSIRSVSLGLLPGAGRAGGGEAVQTAAAGGRRGWRSPSTPGAHGNASDCCVLTEITYSWRGGVFRALRLSDAEARGNRVAWRKPW